MDLRKRDRTQVTYQNRVELLERSYTFPVVVGKLMGAVRKKLKWAVGSWSRRSLKNRYALSSLFY